MRPHAELIEKHLEEKRWVFRDPGTGFWLQSGAPAFNPDFEYKQEHAFTEKRKALVRDWLSGTEYEIKRSTGWEPAEAWDMLEKDAELRRKQPTTVKLRRRTAVLKHLLTGYPPITTTAASDEDASNLEKRKDFIRWMGPWQETEVEI